MRELKFRAWWKDTKRFLDGDEWYMTCSGAKHLHYAVLPYNDDDFIIEQYTGLKDKNGKEIYEGDIILEKWFDKDAHWGEDRVGKCEYFEGSFGCWFAGGRMIQLGMFPIGNIEVIGNIHENPELLEHKG